LYPGTDSGASFPRPHCTSQNRFYTDAAPVLADIFKSRHPGSFFDFRG
jgi:hypothetical protein